MKTIEIDCFEVTESYDRDCNHVAYASARSVANQINGNSQYRSVSEFKKTFTIVESLEELEAMKKKNLAASAKKKMSGAEYVALLAEIRGEI